MPKDFGDTKTVGDALGRDSKDFHPELERIDTDALVGKVFRIDQARLIDWDYQSGESGQFALAKITFPDQTEFVTILGGRAITKQMRKLISLKKLPVVAYLASVAGANGDYRVLQDPPAETEVPA